MLGEGRFMHVPPSTLIFWRSQNKREGNTPNICSKLEFDILTPVAMKKRRTTYLDVTPCSLVRIHLLLGGSYYLRLQGRKVRQVRNPWEAKGKQCRLWLALLSNPEDESSTFVRNVGGLVPDYKALRPKRQFLGTKSISLKKPAFTLVFCSA
jgi:hypothetical protein